MPDYTFSEANNIAKAKAIFEIAFDVNNRRVKRSAEYKEGAYTALLSAASAADTNFISHACKHNPGESAFDAWYAGAAEGRRLWRINGGMI